MLLSFASFALPWPYFFLCALIYAFIFEGVELIVLGTLLDAYLGSVVPQLPFTTAYTLALTGMLVFVWGIKPLLMLDRNDSFA
jgi:hypothetical protein